MVRRLSRRPPGSPFEDVMQAPYPSSLVASAKGNSVAWVFDTKGCRNIWVAQGAHARQITSYTLDDGFDIGDLAWSADQTLIAYVRGGSIEDDLPANVNNSPMVLRPRSVGDIYRRRRAAQTGDGSFSEFFARRQLGWCLRTRARSGPRPHPRRGCGVCHGADRGSGPHRIHDLLARRQETCVRERAQGTLVGRCL